MMPRLHKSSEQRKQARQQTERTYNASSKGKSRQRRWRQKQRDKRIQAIITEQQQIRENTGGTLLERIVKMGK